MTRSCARSLKPELDASQSSDVGTIRLGEATVAAQHAPCDRIREWFSISLNDEEMTPLGEFSPTEVCTIKHFTAVIVSL